MLEEKFGIPVFINNDGDLFAYGEAIAGLLPFINSKLEEAGSPNATTSFWRHLWNRIWRRNSIEEDNFCRR